MDAGTLLDVYKCLNQMSKQVQRNVDMSWLRAWSTHKLKTLGSAGQLDGMISHGGLNRETWVDFTLNGPVTSNVCPCVNIGWLKKEITKIAVLDLGEAESGDPDELLRILRSRFNGKLSECGLSHIDDFDYIGDPDTDRGESLDEIFSALDSLTSLESAFLNRKIDIELRYDSLLERWRTCLLVRPLNTEVGDYQDLQIGFHPTGNVAEFVRLGWEESDGLISLLASKTSDDRWLAFSIHDDTTFHFLGECVDSDQDFTEFFESQEISLDDLLWAKKSVFGYEEGTRLFDKLLLSPNSSVNFNYDWTEKLQYVPAPAGSIASYILRSFCFAPKGQRLDELFVKDAKRKYQVIRNYHEARTQVYTEELNRRLSITT